MLIRDADCDEDPDRWRAFLVDQGFGHVVAGGAGRAVPAVVPTQYVVTETEIVFHLIATNPVIVALEENPRAVLSVAGDWAFIPGAWKAIGDEEPERGIPTTYYAAVQVTGDCVIESASEDIAAVLRTQLAVLDPDHEYVDPTEHASRLRAIRGVRLSIDEVRAKYKYGGNVDREHRDAVATQLRARNGPGDSAALEHLRRTR